MGWPRVSKERDCRSGFNTKKKKKKILIQEIKTSQVKQVPVCLPYRKQQEVRRDSNTSPHKQIQTTRTHSCPETIKTVCVVCFNIFLHD